MTQIDSARAGGCLCGAIRFVARKAQAEVHACHCKMCQRWTGSALVTVSVPAAALELNGAENVATLASSDWAERAWCARCGSGLWFRRSDEAEGEGVYDLPIGLFDDASGFELAGEIFVDRKPAAYALQGDHRRETEAEVLARYSLERGEAT